MSDTLASLLPAAPPPSLTPETLAGAAARLAMWKLDALAVLEGNEVRGVVTVQAPSQIQAVAALNSSATLSEARAALKTSPALAVFHGGAFAALLTAADLAPPAAPELAGQVWYALSEPDRTLLSRLAAQTPGTLALVGGGVRDALLGLPPLDLDIVLVGADVEALAVASGLPFVFHPAYRNATLSLPDGRAADVVSARMERYPFPGASPAAHPGTLAQDLRRRDFALNALALVVGESGPTLHDPHGGLPDLLAHTLRPLSADSLTDDASRLIRGARLSARLDLRASPELTAQVPQALAVAAQTPRLDAELRLLLSEPFPGKVARLLETWGAAELLPAASLPVLDALDALPERPGEQVYAAALLSGSPEPGRLADRLALGPRPAALLSRALGREYVAPGSVEAVLRGVLKPDAYTPLTGRDALKLGATPGPGIGMALAHLAGLRRTGQVSSREGEEAALRAYLAAIP
ncbi:CCA tRNA nucleotidyltransferase [Deinococcus sp.]|uniref:CCA tRNA nucleotidyltransferase n=1 Tax=Deinococcus sp. TaxID=47478 RepID=UPI003B5B966F